MSIHANVHCDGAKSCCQNTNKCEHQPVGVVKKCQAVEIITIYTLWGQGLLVLNVKFN